MAEDGPGQDPKSPQDARLASLDERLARAQAEESERTGRSSREQRKDQVEGTRILSILIGTLLGCALIGYAIGRFAGIRWAMPVMLFLGIGVAMWEVWKISQQGPK